MSIEKKETTESSLSPHEIKDLEHQKYSRLIDLIKLTDEEQRALAIAEKMLDLEEAYIENDGQSVTIRLKKDNSVMFYTDHIIEDIEAEEPDVKKTMN